MFDLNKVEDLEQWRALRTELEKTVLSILGQMPKERAELQAKVTDEVSFATFVRKRVNYFVDEWERVSAWLFVPDGKDELPALLCCHQTVPQGKDEPAGIEGDPVLAFAQHYAELGYVTLAPDCITAGERVSTGLEPYDSRSFYKDHPKMSAMGKMLWDHIHAIDLLCEIKRVDPARIGVIGHSLGGCNALFLAAFEDRIQAAVGSCAFTRFAEDKEPERWARDQGFIHMPKLKPAIAARKFPFDWEHVLALGAPCPVLVIGSPKDEIFPNSKSSERAVKSARTIYKLLGAEGALEAFFHDRGHRMVPETLRAADDWFERWL